MTKASFLLVLSSGLSIVTAASANAASIGPRVSHSIIGYQTTMTVPQCQATWRKVLGAFFTKTELSVDHAGDTLGIESEQTIRTNCREKETSLIIAGSRDTNRTTLYLKILFASPEMVDTFKSQYPLLAKEALAARKYITCRVNHSRSLPYVDFKDLVVADGNMPSVALNKYDDYILKVVENDSAKKSVIITLTDQKNIKDLVTFNAYPTLADNIEVREEVGAYTIECIGTRAPVLPLRLKIN